jgi:predicted XRE-type DNA-binding protein
MPKKTTTEEPAKAILGSGNVFADLGLENPEELLAKAELIRHINTVIDKRGYTQKELATHLDIHQPQVSLLRRGALNNFSLERLLRFIILLGGQVDIRIAVKGHSGRGIQVTFG